MKTHGGARAGAGRKPAHERLKKIPYNTKLPRWLREWLMAPERGESGPVLIEKALCRAYFLAPPESDDHNPGGDENVHLDQ